jgi:protein-L-isoaspartate(D-aspartate) O-methyltransferase
VLSKIAAQVYAIERIADLAREAQSRIRLVEIYNATVKCFDGTLGWAAHAPYDAILVAAGGPSVPEPLIAQLKLGGRLVVPVGVSREAQRLVRVIKTEKGNREEDHGGCAFVPLIGQHGWSER